MTTDDAGWPHVDRQADPAAVTDRVAAVVVDRLGAALADRPTAVLALSGGSTPKPLYARLAAAGLDWPRVHVLQVDERIAPAGDPARNWTAVHEDLVAPSGAIGHPMPVDASDPAVGAAGYGALLADLGRLDVVHLGLGDDGHTASLVPGDPVLAAEAPVAVTGAYQGHRRMTLTAPAIDRAGWIVWQVVGAGKAAAVARLLAGDPGQPARLVRRDRATLVADRAALGAVGG